MKEIEELIHQDREANLPEPPDVAFTVAAVRRRLEPTAARRTRPQDWPLVVGAASLVIGGALAALLAGLHPLWLLPIPAAGLALCPILFTKERDLS